MPVPTGAQPGAHVLERGFPDVCLQSRPHPARPRRSVLGRVPSDGRAIIRCMDVPARASEVAAALARRFEQDAELVGRLNDAQRRLRDANERLWNGLHPDGLAAVYGEHPAAIDAAAATSRSEVLEAEDPLAAVQQVHWTIHRAFVDYQTASEECRQLAATVGELTRELVEVLTDAGWSEHDARNANVHELANPARSR
jgi:hypothetical protein